MSGIAIIALLAMAFGTGASIAFVWFCVFVLVACALSLLDAPTWRYEEVAS